RFARRVVDGAYRPRVSVVVPAYNEEQVVVRTVESLLAQRYAGLEVIVVDDGSPDRTAQVVAAAFRGHPGVRLVRQPNGGKASALHPVGARAAGQTGARESPGNKARALPPFGRRPEEHTSELQLRENLVCRLLVENN